MNSAAHTDIRPPAALLTDCVVGIGSFHGDDRAGWEVIDRLQLRLGGGSQLAFRKAAVPHDVLDWLDPGLRLHLVDACAADVSGVQRLELRFSAPGQLAFSGQPNQDCCTGGQAACGPDDEITRRFAALRSRSTHQFDLLTTLELASALGCLPARLTLWTIAIDSAQPNAEIGPAAGTRVIQCADRIEQELAHA